MNERISFEQWATVWGYEPFERMGDKYIDPCVQKVWRAWCLNKRRRQQIHY